MDFDVAEAFDNVKEGAKKAFDTAHAETKEFHEKYISKVLPDCGKYGDKVAFAAEIVPGVGEYNAVREGDWKAFAIAAGIDIVAIGAGAFTFGAGYAAVKGGSLAAKAGVKVAAKEVAEASTKKVIKEVTETSTEKVIKEVAKTETGTVAREVTETNVEKVTKEVFEEGSEKTVKEISENGTEKLTKNEIEKLEIEDRIKNTNLDLSEGGTKVKWEGERGRSLARPQAAEIKKTLSKYGEEGIMYKDGVPDFSKVTHEEIKINHMTSIRPNNFSEADSLLAKHYNDIGKLGRTDWTGSEIKQYRIDHKLSWHECNDMKTMQLVPRDVHEYFKHKGGVSECKRIERIGGIFDE